MLPHPNHHHRTIRLLSVLLLLILASCGAPSSQNAITSTASPLPSTATATPTVVPTRTLTPVPSITPTLLPTATPPGYFSHDNGGFSISYPAGWQITEKSTHHLGLYDSGSDLFMYLESRSEKEATTIEKILETLKSEVETKEGVTMTTRVLPMVSLANGKQAQRAGFIVETPDSSYEGWLIYTHDHRRGYQITIYAPPGKLELREVTLERIFESLTLFEPQPFGLPKTETLTLLSSDLEPQGLDPARTTGSAADEVGLLFSGLVRLTPDMQIVPDLAEKWEIDAGGTKYTFHLRDNLAFSDGEPLTAQHIKDSWERACDPELGSTTAAAYLGDILGVKQRLEGEAETITGVEVIDERTLQVTLDAPKTYFLAKLTYPTAFVIDTSQVEDDPDAWVFNPHSSGPYMVKEYIPGEAAIYQRNPHYWQPAGVEYLVLLFNPGGAPLSLYEEGVIDLLALNGKDVRAVSKAGHTLNAQLHTMPSLCTSLLLFNASLPPLDDLQVRKALMLAIDRRALNEKLTENTALPATGLLPPAMPGAVAKALPDFDPQAAKEALARSRYAGETLEIVIGAPGYANSQRKDVAFLASQWQEHLEVKVQVEYLDPGDFANAAKRSPSHALIFGWCADYPDPENFLDLLFHSRGPYNVSRLSQPEIDTLLEQARTETDATQRLALYQSIEEDLLENIYTIPLLHDIRAVLVQPRIENFVLSPGQAAIIPQLEVTR